MPHHKPMVPAEFAVPDHVVTPDFVVRPLTPIYASLDHEAWTTSREHLEGIFGPDSVWPMVDMSVDDNFIDLAWHQRENEERSCFAYTVLSPDESRVVGCIYLSPARKKVYRVEAFYWVRSDSVELDKALGDFVKKWTFETWQFTSIVYPGRNVSWDDYTSLPDEVHW